MHLQHHTAEQIRAHMPPALAHRLGDAEALEGIARRSFLKIASASGFALGAYPFMANAQQGAAPAATGLKPDQQPAAFVKIARDGTVTVTINRLEFGQGTHTGLAMVLAEELDADWSRVQAVHGNADPAYNDPAFGMQITGGSTAVKHSYTQYRELGARTRTMLLAAAAKQWDVPASSLATERGVVIGPGGKKLTYGALADAAMQQPVPAQVTLKDPSRFRIIGQPTTRLDAKAKASGQQSFGMDVRLPGMLTAVLQHPPVFGSKVASVDDAAARAVPGVKAVLRVPLHDGGEGVAVVGEGYWAAKQGRDALKVQWNDTGREKVDSAKQLASYRELAAKTGNIKHDADMAPLASAPQKISAEFVFPYLAHAPMEPLNCTVQLSGSGAAAKATVWTGTQMPGLDTAAAARTLGIKPEQVTMNVQMAGGGFGRRGLLTSDFVVEACTIAKATQAAGISAPVRTVWSREDDMRGGYYRPMHVHRAEIGFDAQGKVLAWDHVIVGQSIMAGTFFEPMMVKNGVDETMVEGMGKP
jgi:isoquinoline 1-oxidoreductase subunit beta